MERNDSAPQKQGLEAAIDFARNRDIQGARAALGLEQPFTDDELMHALAFLHQGIQLLISQQPQAAVAPLREALPVVDASQDEDAKSVIRTLLHFAEGLDALMQGDAHRAAQLLNVSRAAAERTAFLIPEFEMLVYSSKALSQVALARAHLNGANRSAAEEALGNARQVHDSWLNKLDPTDPAHLPAFAEIYGTRLEVAMAFVQFDLMALDLEAIDKRLAMTRQDIAQLEGLLGQLPAGPIWALAGTYPAVIRSIETQHHSLRVILVEHRPFHREEVEALVAVNQQLFQARQTAQASGERGRGVCQMIAILEQLQRNLLVLGQTATRDFGRFSGPISLGSLILLMIVLHLTVRPSGLEALMYFFGGLILALIVGFGFGALRFQPLLKMFADALGERRGQKE